MNRLTPIVMLHYVSDEQGMELLEPWNITTQSFIRFLDYLQNNGYQTVGFEDGKDNDAKKSVVITFDDCPKHLWDFAIPELHRRNMKAVFYVPTAYIGGVDEWNDVKNAPAVQLMDAADIERLVTLGMEVGAHSHEHIWLEKETSEKALHDITLSKKILEDITHKPVVSVAYPFGSLPKNYYKNMRKAGFLYGSGVFTKWENRYSLGRWIFSNDLDDSAIGEKMQEEYMRKLNFNDTSYVVMTALYRFIHGIYSTIRYDWLKLPKKAARRRSPGFLIGFMDVSEIWTDSVIFSFFEEGTLLISQTI